MKEAKLDAAGEAQQVMMMLAMWREIMNIAKPAPPPPIPRPIELVGDLGWRAVLTIIDSGMWMGDKFIVHSKPHENTTSAELESAVHHYVKWRDGWIEKLNTICWRVSIPDQPVMLRSVKMANAHYVDEILTVPIIDPSTETVVSHPVRLGWLPGTGLSELQDMFNTMAEEFAESPILAIFDKRSEADKKASDMLVKVYCPRFVDHESDETNVYGRIIDGWLFVYPNLEGDEM